MTLDVVILYICFALILALVGWLTARMRQHDDVLLDLRFKLNDVRGKLTTKRDQYGKGSTYGNDR